MREIESTAAPTVFSAFFTRRSCFGIISIAAAPTAAIPTSPAVTVFLSMLPSSFRRFFLRSMPKNGIATRRIIVV